MDSIKWIDVKDQMPKTGKPVLARCLYSEHHKTYRQFIGEHYGKHESESCPDSEIFDYDDKTDSYYIPQGWYEQTLWSDEYSSMLIGYDVTHRMPLPAPPS